MMSPQLEIEGDFEAEALVNIDPSRSGVRLQTTFIQEVKHNFNVVKNALKINILRQIYIYYLLVSVTFPFLWNFMYYFQRDVAGLSQVKIQLLHTIDGVWSISAILIYKKFLQQVEPRTLIITIILIQIAAGVSDFCFVMRWNLVLGINDFTW